MPQCSMSSALQSSTATTLHLLILIVTAMIACNAAAESLVGSNSYVAAFRDIGCQSDVILFPAGTEDVSAAIKNQTAAAAAAGGAAVKIRASHSNFHSTSPFTCPGTTSNMYVNASTDTRNNSAAGVRTVTLLLDNMMGVLLVDKEKHLVRAQAGMFVSKLLQVAADNDMSVPLGSVPQFGDLTLGGVLLTGAHGSGLNKTSSLADILLEITWVDAKGKVHVDSRSSTAGRAFVGGLGVAGVVTELLLQLQGPTHTSLETWYKRSDSRLVQDVQLMLQKSPHVLVIWRPDIKQYTAYITKEVSASVPAIGGMINIDLPPFVAKVLGKSLQLWQADVEDRMALAAVPVLAMTQEMSVGHAMANEEHTQRKIFDGVGDTNKMQAASCGNKCLWNLGTNIAMDDVHFSIELDQLQGWVDDVKALIVADLWEYGMRRHRLLGPGFFWLRFGRGSQDLISHTSGMRAPVHVQMSFMKSIVDPDVPNKWGWILEALEQITLCKYKGKPHWGKNKPRIFTHATCNVKDNLPFWPKMMDFQQQHDPNKVFEPKLFADMAAGRSRPSSAGCAVRGECFCTDASHCAPGYQCVKSAAFPEYHICRLPLAKFLWPL